MWIYFLIFFIALIGVGNPKQQRSTGYLAFFFILMALFVGCADMLGGYDRYIYTDLFEDVLHARIHDIPIQETTIWGWKNEHGFAYLNHALSFVTANRYIFVLIMTCMIYALMFLSFKDYMDSYPIAIMLFLALMFFFTFTYMREVCGVALAWYGMRYAYKGNILLFALFTAVAFTIHNSAIIFAPFVVFFFLPVRKLPKTLVVNVMAVIFLVGLTPFPSSLFIAFSDVTDDGGRGAGYYGDFDAGVFRYEYLLQAAFFLWIILTNYDKIPNTKRHIMSLNAALVFCAVITFFVRSSNGGRLSWYYMAGLIATVTTILTQQHVRSQLKTYMMIVCFLLYGRIVKEWGGLLSPYKSFFTNGVRENDPMEKFEYDWKYAEDKFYRPAFILFKDKEELIREGL